MPSFFSYQKLLVIVFATGCVLALSMAGFAQQSAGSGAGEGSQLTLSDEPESDASPAQPDAPAIKADPSQFDTGKLAAALQIMALGEQVTNANDNWEWPVIPTFQFKNEITYDRDAAQAALERLNYYRELAGSPPVTLDEDLSRACQLHADFLILNNAIGHFEPEDWPGATSAGDWAGKKSMIYSVQANWPIYAPVDAVDDWMYTLYHRIDLLNPNLRRIGVGYSIKKFKDNYQRKVLVLDCKTAVTWGEGEIRAFRCFPAPGMTGVYPQFNDTEVPDPLPTDSERGTVITFQLFGAYGSTFRDVAAQLTNLSTGQPVPVYLHTPQEPYLPDRIYERGVFLIPKDILPLSTEFLVQLKCKVDVDGEMYAVDTSWRFTTADTGDWQELFPNREPGHEVPTFSPPPAVPVLTD
jgi:uncharacterized protein YkwD